MKILIIHDVACGIGCGMGCGTMYTRMICVVNWTSRTKFVSVCVSSL